MKRRFDKRLKRTLAAYSAREVTPSESASVRALLDEAPELERHVASLCTLQERLARPLEPFEQDDLADGIRASLHRRAQQSALPSATGNGERRWFGNARLTLAGWVAAALVALVAVHAPRELSYRARSAAGGAEHEQRAIARWTGLRAFAKGDDGQLRRLARRLRAEDALAFTYVNLGPRPFAHLMIFALDASGEIRWYYPAYEQPDTDPTSVAIAPGRGSLPDAVYHELARGPLVLHALFTPQPLHVQEVERWMQTTENGDAPPPWPGAYAQRLELTVE